ncbi:hypothetical protein FB45DRAFT_375565 [Roridomyces roridus]|uniref:DUF6534 domain-containing protein n=1 Tax=Roridomyces roridus TaxID=1738132 RepID=A0AAD7B3T7_9AGAR|nr:hypothetical protein FB45DRAFT_375565 [Roridomyces roridus]
MDSPGSSSASATSLDVNGTLGALQIGVLISYTLFGLSTNQTYLYFGRFPNDSKKMKLLVAFVWLCELGHVVCIGHSLYSMTITDYAHPERLVNGPPVSLGASTLLNAVIELCVQGFFSHRIYRLSKRLFIPCLTWTLSLLFLVGTTLGFIVGVCENTLMMTETKWTWLFYSIWGVGAVNDLIISATLVFWLYSKRDESHQRTTALLDTVITWTIETGVVTSAAILNSVCFVTMRNNNLIWIAWYVVTARLYSNSFLSSLNSRVTLRIMNESQILPLPMWNPNAVSPWMSAELPISSSSSASLTRSLR